MVGLINAAFSSMGPVYAQDSLDGADAVATVMTVTILSGFVLQVPIGRLSDRFDRRQVILGLNIVMTVVSLLLAAFGALSLWVLFPLLALFGGLSATLYPLCLSHANDFMTPIHNRMPVILRKADYATWLDPNDVPASVLQPLLKPFDPRQMDAYEVSRAVNTPSIDEPDLIRPVA